MAFAKVLSRNDDHRAREIDSDCRVTWCWGWLEKEITLNYGGTDLATTVGEFYRKIESCGIARCVLCDDNTPRLTFNRVTNLYNMYYYDGWANFLSI